MKRRSCLYVLLIPSSAACDGSTDGDAGLPDGGDAGVDTALPDLPFEIALPAPPAKPETPAAVNPPSFGT